MDHSLNDVALNDDLMNGAAEIAAFFGWQPRRVYHEIQRAGQTGIPLFKIGSTIQARKSQCRRWIADLEAKAKTVEAA